MAYDFWESMKKFMKGELKTGTGPNTITIRPTMNPAETIANIQKLAAMRNQVKPQRSAAIPQNTAGIKPPVQLNTQGKTGGYVAPQNPVFKNIADMVFNTKKRTQGVNKSIQTLNLTANPFETSNNLREAVKNYQPQKPKTVETIIKTDSEYEQRLKEAEQSLADTNNALAWGQQISKSIGYGSNEPMPDLQKLQADVEKAVANLRNIQAEHPDGNPVEYCGEQFLLGMRSKGRNADSRLFSQIGAFNEDVGSVIRGGDPQTIPGHITKIGIDNLKSPDELVNACSDRINILEQKEKVENLPLNEQLELFYLKDFLSQGGESIKRIKENYDENQADTQEVERLYTNLPQYQRDIAGTIGLGLSDAMSSAIPVAGQVFTYYSAGGEAAEDALNDGASLQEANLNAGLTGAIKVTLGEILSGIKLLDNVLGSGIAESVSETLKPFVDRLTYNPEAPLPTLEELTKAFKSGSIAKAFSEILKIIISKN